jgi:hypothetical protein
MAGQSKSLTCGSCNFSNVVRIQTLPKGVSYYQLPWVLMFDVLWKSWMSGKRKLQKPGRFSDVNTPKSIINT